MTPADPDVSGQRRLLAGFVAVLAGAAALRLAHLGYSHFQGDEIKALVPAGAGLLDHLFQQKKGPTQFVVAWLVRAATGGYAEWATRLPFALASLATVVVVFQIVRAHWSRGAALAAAALVGWNGLLVAFGRIVQYQAFCMLFVALAAAFGLRAIRSGRPRDLFAGAAAFGLALLTHYDALTFAPAMLVMASIVWCRWRRERPRTGAALVAAGALAAGIAALFYVPYALQPEFPAIVGYLTDRVAAGRGLGTFARASELVGLYFPPGYLWIAGLLATAGLVVLARRRGPADVVLAAWVAVPFAFYMLLGGDPRSHVYNFVLPGLLVAAVGLDRLIAAVGGPGIRRAAWAAAWIALTASGGAAYYMFVDHSVEHPWSRKTILGRELPNLEARHVEGVFGFPYRRGLDEVGALFASGEFQGTFDSNERDVMADYYFRARRATGRPDHYVYVHRPLSLDRELPPWVREEYEQTREVRFAGRPAVDIHTRLPAARVDAAGDPPFGWIDEPRDGARVGRDVALRGWALAGAGIAEVRVRLDEGPWIPLALGEDRPDVRQAHPRLARGSAGHGWRTTLALPPGTGAGPHVLLFEAVDRAGVTREIGRVTIEVQPGPGGQPPPPAWSP